MRVGTGRAKIRFPADFFPSEGFTTVLSPLWVRVFVLKGEGEFALLSIELTSLPDDEVNHLKGVLSRESGVTEERCWVTVTHTFSAPHFMPQDPSKREEQGRRNDTLRSIIEEAARESVAQAIRTMGEARLSFGKSSCPINVNRDIESAEGWWVGNSGKGASEKGMSVLRADDLSGELIGVLMHYPVQSSIMDGSISKDGGKAVTGDLAGKASSLLEERYPNSTAIFLMGAAGDQAPVKKARTMVLDGEGRLLEVDEYEKGIGFIEELGSQIARCAAEAMDQAEAVDQTEAMDQAEAVDQAEAMDQAAAMDQAEATDQGAALPKVCIKYCSREFSVPAKYMNPNLRELKPTRKYEYIPQGNINTKIEAVAIGELVLLGVKPELNCITAMQILETSPFQNTLVLPMVNGGAKYMADQESYDRCTYEAMNSPFHKGAAELLCQEAKIMLEELKAN